jgi:D-alanyl-D-alanine carboxypeptidase
MTAFVVLRLAAKEPGLPAEIVTYMKRADDTTGSTAGVKAGERLPVRELLYELLLPWGNDAAVAIAEHFGGRLKPADDKPGTADPFLKTGTTSAAGECLVASGRRGSDHLIVVILGASSTEARYADARNLFRYGWLMRGHRPG